MAAYVDQSAADEILAALRGEFITDTMDRLDRVEQVVEEWRKGVLSDVSTLAEIRREAHSIKGMGATFGFPVVSSIAHRLEDYLANVTAITERHVKDGFQFVDTLREIVEIGKDPGEQVSAGILRTLPAKWLPTVDVTVGSVEILVGVNSVVMQSAIEREVYALGYRVVTTKSAVDVLQLAVSMSPNAVIVAAVMDDLSGLDVARALGAMERTRDIPVGLLTSFSDDKLQNLPPDTVIIRKDSSGFAAGLAEIALQIKVETSGVIRAGAGAGRPPRDAG